MKRICRAFAAKCCELSVTAATEHVFAEVQLHEQQLRTQWLDREVPTDDDVGVTATEHAVGNATEHDGVVATEHGGVAATEHGLSTGCYRARSFHRHQWDRTKDIGDRTMCWTAAQALHTSHILSWVVTTSMRHNACWATYKAANLRAIMLVGGIGGLSARQLLFT